MKVKQIDGVSIIFYDSGFIDTINNIGFSKDVVIPDIIDGIKYNCFYKSHIRRITNIEHVTEICDSAFPNSAIEEIAWPEKCFVIPFMCFSYCTELVNISVPGPVTVIYKSAFENCSLANFRWPSKCREIPSQCFHNSLIKTVTNLDNVVEIGDHAFARCYSVANIDLSSSIVSSIKRSAFCGIRREHVSPPYYVSDKEFDFAFLL